MDITIDVDNYKLNVRAAGIMIHNGKILVHKNINSDHYALIGGRVKIGENSADTIKREIKSISKFVSCNLSSPLNNMVPNKPVNVKQNRIN